MASIDELLPKVKANLNPDTQSGRQPAGGLHQGSKRLCGKLSAPSGGHYAVNPMPPTTEQAVIMLSGHFYESRDGSTAGFFADNVQAGQQVWNTVNLLLRLDRRWSV